jgi:hypothetical protein
VNKVVEEAIQEAEEAMKVVKVVEEAMKVVKVVEEDMKVAEEDTQVEEEVIKILK